MATINSPIAAAPLMADVSFPPTRAVAALSREKNAVGSALYQRRASQDIGMLELLPNPDFVFPPRPLDTPPVMPHWNALNRRPRSDQDLSASASAGTSTLRHRPSANNLPHFSFNPSAEQTSTPPQSPAVPPSPTTPSRGARHRRGGSEFIGGDGKTGAGVVLMSSSPTKETFGNSPARLAPPPGRRHAHRRSGAISCHDLQAIMQKPAESSSNGRCGSAPVTPLEADNKPFFSPTDNRRSASSTSLRGAAELRSGILQEGESPQRRPPSRARVGFAERVEYIRPLSTISSETESSLSTVRGHSVSNSLSSVISAGAASPPSARMAKPSLNTTFEDGSQSPTASKLGSGFEPETGKPSHEQPENRPQTSESSSSPSETNSPTSAPKRKPFPWWDARRSRSPPPSLPDMPSVDSDPCASPLESPTFASDTHLSPDEDDQGRRGSTCSQKSPRKPRKVKSWAHSIISRKQKGDKSKKHDVKATTLPMSPASPSTTDSFSPAEDTNFVANFDVDNTVTIISGTPLQHAQPSQSPPLSAVRSQSPDSDPRSPIIDLDAALGPFNTPLGHASRGTRQPARAHRSMQSLAINGPSLSVPLPSHRRTESAPELVPFDMRNSKTAPPPSMPDVFEEDEEQLENAKRRSLIMREETAKEDNDEMNDSGMVLSMDCDSVEGTDTQAKITQQPEPVVNITSPKSQPREENDVPPGTAISCDRASFEVVEDYEEPRDSKASDETITPGKTHTHTPPPLMQYSFPVHQPVVLTPDTISGSSFPSPDFSYSQASFDTPRLGTAASSVNDARSFSIGEPGPEVRISVDDVPSLTSSRSTMTAPSSQPRPCTGIPGSVSAFGIAAHPQYPGGHHPGTYRPLSHGAGIAMCSGNGSAGGSVSSTVRPKRNSIASLSRLMTAGFAERSKLSIESRPMSQHTEVGSEMGGSVRRKKGSRLSRIMGFWKGSGGEVKKA